MIPVIAAILVALLIIAALLWVVFGRGSRRENTATAAPVATAPVEPAPEPSPAPAETAKPEVAVEQPAPQEPAAAPVEEETAPPPEPPVAVSRKRPPAPVKSYKVPRTIPKEGIRYKIRWGDTLWDISEAFYRNPWLYPRIARFNKIRNPDLIISGTYLRVPPKQ